MHSHQLFATQSVPEPLIIDTEIMDDTIRVRVSGEVDVATVDPLAQALSAALAQRPDLVEVDLHQVAFIDSSGIAALLRAHRAAVEAGCRLRVVRPQRAVYRVLDICGLLAHLGL
ncbi:STAS domain-containing protein [Planosporangium sp. 12N6]|uniref:STAS domain-containing protein n=1 Tax=Planosporangium spinosum TaxID=3402278 RepID=UPI003CE984CE